MVKPVLKLSTLGQIGIAVRDLDKSMERMWNVFGIGPWKVYIRDCNSSRDGQSIRDMTYYGKPSQFSFNIAVSKAGDMALELVQPVSGDNIYSDFLREHGEGVQHLGWHFVTSLEDMAKLTSDLEKEGFPCITSARLYHVAIAFFDTTKVLGNVLEVIWKDTTKVRPPPDRIYPE